MKSSSIVKFFSPTFETAQVKPTFFGGFYRLSTLIDSTLVSIILSVKPGEKGNPMLTMSFPSVEKLSMKGASCNLFLKLSVVVSCTRTRKNLTVFLYGYPLSKISQRITKSLAISKLCGIIVNLLVLLSYCAAFPKSLVSQ